MSRRGEDKEEREEDEAAELTEPFIFPTETMPLLPKGVQCTSFGCSSGTKSSTVSCTSRLPNEDEEESLSEEDQAARLLISQKVTPPSFPLTTSSDCRVGFHPRLWMLQSPSLARLLLLLLVVVAK